MGSHDHGHEGTKINLYIILRGQLAKPKVQGTAAFLGTCGDHTRVPQGLA